MKKTVLSIVLVCMAFFSVTVSASTVTSKIKSISLRDTGHIVFNLVRKSGAICARSGFGGFYITSTNPQYKSLYAALLTAQSQDWTVTVVGKNACSWGTNEDVLWIITNS